MSAHISFIICDFFFIIIFFTFTLLNQKFDFVLLFLGVGGSLEVGNADMSLVEPGRRVYFTEELTGHDHLGDAEQLTVCLLGGRDMTPVFLLLLRVTTLFQRYLERFACHHNRIIP